MINQAPNFHILCNPNSTVHPDNTMDPFSQAVLKFVKNMGIRGWNSICYTVGGSQVDCEQVVCLNSITPSYDNNVKIYNSVAGEEIKKRKKAGDFVLCFYGTENALAANSNSDLTIVEPSIGYNLEHVFAPYRVFTSYSQMHYYYGLHKQFLNPSWWDTVIPNCFTPEDFLYNEHKEDYFIVFGRVIKAKGIDLAIQVTKELGRNLVIAGPGKLSDLGYSHTPPHVELLGLQDKSSRMALLSKAAAVLGPTYYQEPFGNMVVEGYLSGTPAITTDWGGFVDTVVNGVTGYRCKQFDSWVKAGQNIGTISSKDCYDYAVQNYTEKTVHDKFHEYFTRLQHKDFYKL